MIADVCQDHSDKMKDTIVFCLNVDNEESYGEVANFIYKRETHADITQQETMRITYKYYLKNNIVDKKEWINCVIRDGREFASIKEANKIKATPNRFEIVYCICVNVKSDIIDLSNLYLLKSEYPESIMPVLFRACGNDDYFTISQFLYSVGTYDTKFYEDCFFQYGDSVQRAQKKGIYFSRYFTPLQVINDKNVKRIFQKTGDLLTKEYLGTIHSTDVNTAEEITDLVDGSVKILFGVKKYFSRLADEHYLKLLQNIDVLTFVLVCYALQQLKKELTLSNLERLAFQMQQYSNAIHQLAENIIFHSKAHEGVIAIRFHDRGSAYIKEKYGADSKNSFLEIMIGDFTINNRGGNISNHFLAHMGDDNMRKEFAGLCPQGFFDHNSNDQTHRVWGEYYKNPDNIGKHFGLQIFRSIVTTYSGMFGAESHEDYINKAGDSFLSYQGKEPKTCMPGTRYHIVFPLENIQNVVQRQDLSLDSGLDIGSQINKYFQYTTGKLTLRMRLDSFDSQEQKNSQILKLADYLRARIEKQHRNIVYIPLNQVEDNRGETVAKAIVMALFGLDFDTNIVLYQCSANLKKNIFDTMRIFFNTTDMAGMFFNRDIQIILYSETYEESVLDLSSIVNTDSINAYISHMKCIAPVDGYISADAKNLIDINRGAVRYIPCDVLHKVQINNKTQTLFEHFTEEILKNSIQNNEFGCQLEHTHMRLGSTIHIDQFYEAEFLFGNKLFVSRFAWLLVKDLKDKIKNVKKLTLYGYGTYSETVLVQMIVMIQKIYPEKKDVDYIILEREEERRGFLHKDRIRYNRYFESDEDRIKYYKDRKIAIIVLINSTLKTHMRLINLFREENDITDPQNQWIIKNYAVLLVGNNGTNSYWEIYKNKVKVLKEEISPVPQYFIQVNARYQEPLDCLLCFPDNPVAEIPLIEVNAASTIPNQAFGIIANMEKKLPKFDYQMIQAEQNKLDCVKKEFSYGHVQRNENHFLYYFHTENICIKQKDAVELSLKDWQAKISVGAMGRYNIIVAPMHYSNAGFVEMVNTVIFYGNAILLRIDFDKEYRCNAYTKYSYLRNYIKQLKESAPNEKIGVHYVDDAIISGRTYFRARSLMRTILGINNEAPESKEIKLFDKVFVLIDRNSSESRNQYVLNEKQDYYAFIKINISSLRNYGDSCVCCNLKREADFLWETASTKAVADYWKSCAEKFKLHSLEEYSEINNSPDYEKQFRRLFCTHIAKSVLHEKNHGNDHVRTMWIILSLLNTDYELRKEDKFEYFLSYLKCISRPFLVFQKVIKEAIFDIMLILIDAIVCDKSLDKVIENVQADKAYLNSRSLKVQFKKLNKNILGNSGISETDKRDLVKLLMKQLTELKSNYIIRPEKMEAIFSFMSGSDIEMFKKDYLVLIDRLVAASSDTNKSLWLDSKIMGGKFNSIPQDFRVWILLENTRTFRDGIEKLYKRIYDKESRSEDFFDIAEKRIQQLEKDYDYERAIQMFKTFEKKHKEELTVYETSTDKEFKDRLDQKIDNFLKSLPTQMNARTFMDEAKKAGDRYAIFKSLQEWINEDYETMLLYGGVGTIEAKLRDWIESETDRYQFHNFYTLLKGEGYYNDDQLSLKGIDMLVCCAKAFDLCRNTDAAILDKVQMLAVLFKIILNAHKVQFIIENRADRNLDEWRHSIETRYNAIVDKYNAKNNSHKLNPISIKAKGHYTVIVEKAGNEDLNTEVSDETEKIIERLESETIGEGNFLIAKERGALIWKLENKQRKIWINVENSNWNSEAAISELEIARSARKIMMFYGELMIHIFNAENDDFMNEISHTRKELSIYTSNKVYTHTKDYSREMLMDQAKMYFEQSQKDHLDNYPSYVLKLLADINISQYYRRGLRASLYQEEKNFNEFARWKDISGLLSNEQEFKYCIGQNDSVSICLKVCDINENDQILCENSKNSIREMSLLIHSLIMNAAEIHRGKRENGISGVQSEGNYVIVRIYKDDSACLVIENECENEVDVAEISHKLQRIPDAEEDGISLWSFNCYIRQCINYLIMEKLKKAEQDSEGYEQSEAEIRVLGEWIEMLTGGGCEIQPESGQKNGKYYFSVKLPIFMEKYQLSFSGKESINE